MSADDRFQSILSQISSLRLGLVNHPIYRSISSIDALRLFMQHHVFAVWDFMSLLKAMQLRISCVSVPWLPPVDLVSVRFINEIVLGEESDDDGKGGFASHFDLYRGSMIRCGANTNRIDRFLKMLAHGSSVNAGLAETEVPDTVQQFVRQTFEVIDAGEICAIASAFTFGREDLLPEVFQRIVDELNEETLGELDDFKFYLNRHIELDGNQHGPMAAKLMASLCGEDESKWKIAEITAIKSLQARMTLWDGMLAAIHELHPIS